MNNRSFRHPVPLVLLLAFPLAAALPARVRVARPNPPTESTRPQSVIEKTRILPELDREFAPELPSVPAGTDAVQTASNYAFATTTSGSLTDMSSGTTQLLAANIDDTASALTSIGFDFFFQGARFTQFSINDNGVLRLGATAQTSTPYQPLAQAGIPIITAYGGDQRTHIGDGKVHFKVTGSAPSRVLTIEWLNNQSNFNVGGTADLTYQVRLYETTGVIEFVYGSMTMSTLGATDTNAQAPNIGFSSGNVAGAVGSVTAPQSGVPAPTFDGASATAVANLYTAGAITVLSSASNGSRRTFSFTPPVPTAPSGLNFTGVGPVAMTLNWTDSPDETLYAIYRSTDGVNYAFDGTAAQNATAYAASGLLPSTTYFWQVFAVSEGALSAVLAGSQATLPAGNVSSTLVGGNWSATGTWVGGVVPGPGDNVTIVDGSIVTIDTAATALSLAVGTGGVPAVLQWEATNARTLAVGMAVNISATGIFQSATTGTQTGHVLTVGTDLTNNGVVDFSTNGNTAGAGITFTGAADANFTLGAASTTDFKQAAGVTLNKGTSSTPVLTFTPGGVITVQGANTLGFLTVSNGTFKLGGTGAFSNPAFSAAAYAIPAAGGFWMNNPNATVAGQGGSSTVTGLFRMSQGTFNIGTLSGNSMGFAAGARITVEGGAINAAGRFGVASAGNAITYTQSGGLITVCTVGNVSVTLASFDLGTSLSSAINMSGGTIVVQLANTGSSGPRDYRHQSGSGPLSVSGGTLQLGNAASGAAKAFTIAGSMPNLALTNTSANHSATVAVPAVYINSSQNITINAGNVLTIANTLNAFFFYGATLLNNGAIVGGGTSVRFDFGGPAPMTYGGTGTFGTAAATFNSISSNSFQPITLNSPIVVSRVNLFTGGFVNSSQITLGNGGASTTVVQIGFAGLATPGGSFDVSPNHQQGTGGEVLIYAAESQQRTTSFEINPTRIANRLTVDNVNGVVLSGGDLSLFSIAISPSNALTLTNGRVITGSGTIALTDPASAVVRTNGYIDGALRKNFNAIASKAFEVGTATGYAPVTANVTAGTFPADVTVRSQAGKLPAVGGLNAISRYWTLAGTGLTADLTFQYIPADVQGNEANYGVIKYDTGVLSNPPGQSVNSGAHSGTAPGVTSFSDWTVGELPPSLFRNASLGTLTPTPAQMAAIFPNSPADPALAASDLEQSLYFSNGSFPNSSQDYSDNTRIIIFYQTNTSGSNTLRVGKDTVGGKVLISY